MARLLPLISVVVVVLLVQVSGDSAVLFNSGRFFEPHRKGGINTSRYDTFSVWTTISILFTIAQFAETITFVQG